MKSVRLNAAVLMTSLLGAASPNAATAAVIFSDDFTKQKPGWSFSSPSTGFLGELNDNVNVSSVSLNLNVPTALTTNVSFDLLGFRALDGVNCCTDTLTFSINGTTALTGAYSHNPAINQLLSNPGGASVSQLWVNTPPVGVGTANSGHRFEVPNVSLNAGINTFTWSYSSLQSLEDEAWGLDNVKITAPSVTFEDLIRNGVATPTISGNKIRTTFKPNYPVNLSLVAQEGGFDHFNWVQMITDFTWLSDCFAAGSGCDEIRDQNGALPAAIPFFDAQPGGYQYQTALFGLPFPVRDSLVYYLDELYTANGHLAPTSDQTALAVNTPDDEFLRFFDGPCVPAGHHVRFTTVLTGVRSDGTRAAIAHSPATGTAFRWSYENPSGPPCSSIVSGVEFFENLDPSLIGPGTTTFEGFTGVGDFTAEELEAFRRAGIEVLGSTSVPEPSTLLLAFGPAGALVWFRRKANQSRVT